MSNHKRNLLLSATTSANISEKLLNGSRRFTQIIFKSFVRLCENPLAPLWLNKDF